MSQTRRIRCPSLRSLQAAPTRSLGTGGVAPTLLRAMGLTEPTKAHVNPKPTTYQPSAYLMPTPNQTTNQLQTCLSPTSNLTFNQTPQLLSTNSELKKQVNTYIYIYIYTYGTPRGTPPPFMMTSLSFTLWGPGSARFQH